MIKSEHTIFFNDYFVPSILLDKHISNSFDWDQSNSNKTLNTIVDLRLEPYFWNLLFSWTFVLLILMRFWTLKMDGVPLIKSSSDIQCKLECLASCGAHIKTRIVTTMTMTMEQCIQQGCYQLYNMSYIDPPWLIHIHMQTLNYFLILSSILLHVIKVVEGLDFVMGLIQGEWFWVQWTLLLKSSSTRIVL